MKNKPTLYHNSCYAMGTRLNAVIVNKPYSTAADIFELVATEVKKLDKKLSRFSQTSDISYINKTAALNPIAIDAEMAEILSLCLEYYRKTNGAFNIILSSKSKLRQLSPAGCFRQAVEYFADTGLCGEIELDMKRSTVRFLNPEIGLDLGGFGKGYALAKVQRILNDNGVANALVSFGESSIWALGSHPFGNCWKIGIENIYDPLKSAYVFELKNQSLSTSSFKRCSNKEHQYHIVSPVTAEPVRLTASISVKSSDCLKAEILSTAIFASLDNEISFLKNFDDCDVVHIDYGNNKLLRINEYELR